MKSKLTLILALLALFGLSMPALAGPDLIVQDVTFLEGPKVGPCNKIKVTVKNVGDALANEITAAEIVIRKTSNAFQISYQKKGFLSAIAAGSSRSYTFSNADISEADAWTVQVVADSESKVTEDDENNNIYSQTGIDVSEPCEGCDLKAQFTSPTSTSLPGTYPAKFTVKYTNDGGASCPSRQVRLTRYSGSSASGSGTTIGTQSLASTSPNQYKNVSWTDSSHAQTGQFTYLAEILSHDDSNNNNHTVSKTVTFTLPSGGGGGNPPGCDLQVTWVAPSGTTVPPDTSYNWQLKFENIGSATCNGNKIKLSRYGSSCGGYGTQIGGSRAFQTLNELRAGASQTLTFAENRTPKKSTSYYCYKFAFSSPHNDDNGANHSPSKIVKKVRFQ